MEIEGSLLVAALSPISAITLDPKKNAIVFLKSLKEAFQ